MAPLYINITYSYYTPKERKCQFKNISIINRLAVCPTSKIRYSKTGLVPDKRLKTIDIAISLYNCRTKPRTFKVLGFLFVKSINKK